MFGVTIAQNSKLSTEIKKIDFVALVVNLCLRRSRVTQILRGVLQNLIV